jgi:excisionase family DNA binding protein
MTRDRVTVQEAARRLGVKDDAVRKRIQRGTLEHDKDSDGRVYVYLDLTKDEANAGQDAKAVWEASQVSAKDALVMAKDETISELRDQIGFLRRELERKDAILMSLTQRVPELEAPPREPALSQEPPGASRSVVEQSDRGEESLPGGGEAQEGSERPSWWRRVFGG